MEIEPLTNESYTLTITQPNFVEDLLLEFGNYLSTETVNVPIGPGTAFVVNEPDVDPDLAEQRYYRNLGLSRASCYGYLGEATIE